MTVATRMMVQEERWKKRDPACRTSATSTIKRTVPPQLVSPDWGAPEAVWAALCNKDELHPRGGDMFRRNPLLERDMRRVLIDWIMEVCADKHLHRETFHLSIDYMDRFLAKRGGLVPSQMQLVGTTALFIASKVEEIYPPNADDLAHYTDGCCSSSQVIRMEEEMLEALEWNCNPVTSLHWLQLYLQLLNTDEEMLPQTPGGTSNSCSSFGYRTGSSDSFSMECMITNLSSATVAMDSFLDCSVPNFSRDDFIRLATVLDLVLFDTLCLGYKYSELAASVVYCCFEPSGLVERVTGYTKSQLTAVIKFVKPFVEVCSKFHRPGWAVPDAATLHDVLVGDLHNIQVYTYIHRPLARYAEVQDLVQELSAKEAEDTYKRKKNWSRKRQHP